jgi:hypothetical protein
VASINVKSLRKPVETYQGFTYSDLKLDLQFDYTRNNELLKNKEIKDSVNSLDFDAIRNSIFNLFTTIPGQKILNPAYGLSLAQYLFEGVSQNNGYLIAQEIVEGINKYEPRVYVNNVDVVVNVDQQQYDITLTITVPRITNQSFRLIGTLSNSGFYFNN